MWTPAPGAPSVDASPAVVLSVVHPHPVKRFTSVALAAFDLQRVTVNLVAGTAEPASQAVPPERRTGLIPASDLSKLLVVFNGGFQAKHGHYGMRIGDDLFLPAIDDACTFGLHGDGSVSIGTWTALRGREPTLVAWRQTPPCLIERGATNPSIEREGASRKWGISIEGKLEIRRSAVGVDASGRVLLFGIGEEVTPKDLAVAMQAAGAVDAAQLDINWSYTRFLIYGPPEASGAPKVVHTLLPKMKYGKQEYVSRGAPRDFFYVARKSAL